MPRRRPTRQGEPTHLVLDDEALGQISGGSPSRPLLVAPEAAAATGGRILLPTSVVAERGRDRRRPSRSTPTAFFAPPTTTSSPSRAPSKRDDFGRWRTTARPSSMPM